ncbi:efflux RND transporter periplasmic adaptor subunit [Actinacidiphila bryophytorum]|uniref:Membrane fusion protein, macrolide-specific efflux system n=1 Tax=Actinacidiphila bryophytorum TaxID=1436133 RepID=A0A9W4H4Y5_9ACTN|nr:biotin/lipoyl-binding protein [Actinacidiphila bryophytorum]MBM9437433.1 biotin/lipoyl-binding protein [Actinacidiphila bryophytorum]MBN6547003.1 biotin/lipoyl-binding protein [Actinacidiphila bryophytorum]CAG7652105.1 Membrane fusion protein, macrolide-specific efflux system [Actinacidiphila bryophytorum]
MKVLPRRRRAALINSVLGVVVLAGVGGAYAAVHDDGSKSTGSGTARVATVTKGTVLATVSGSGTLASPSDAGLDFTTGGTLTKVNVKPGDKVTKGEVLAEVDDTDAKATLQQDQASLTAAEANLTKVEAGELPASSGTSGGGDATGSGRGTQAATPTPSPTPTVDAAQLAQAQAQVTQAQNAVDAAQRAVDGTTLKAPVAGTVASVSAAKGDTVSGTGGSGSGAGSGAGSSSNSSSNSSSSSGGSLSGFIVLTNPAGMQVTADFSEADSLKVKAGQSATVTLNAQSGTVLDAKVLSVSSLPVSSGSGSGSGSGSSGSAVQYAATLQITSDTSQLRTGLSASIQVTTGSASDALSVPTAAVSGTGANRTVLLVNPDGSTTRTAVTVGIEGDSTDQITSGLAEGQQVQIPTVASAGSNGFPSGAFPGGLGGGAGRFGGAGGGVLRGAGGGGARG